jgi:hypothetical protein
MFKTSFYEFIKGEIVLTIINGKQIDYHSVIIKQVQDYIDQKVDVYIWRTDEVWSAEDWHYAVVVKNSNGFWLDAFDTEQQAIDFCLKNELKIVE